MRQEPRLREVESKLDRLLVVVGELVKRFDGAETNRRTAGEKTDSVLYGDGNGKRGVLVRIDRLEQSQSRSSRFMWLLAGAAVAALLSQIMG